MEKVEVVLNLIEKLDSLSDNIIKLSQTDYEILLSLKNFTAADFESDEVYENLCNNLFKLDKKLIYFNDKSVHVFEILPILNDGEIIYQIILNKLKKETANYKIISLLNIIPSNAVYKHIDELRPIILQSIHDSNGLSSSILEHPAVKNDEILSKILSYIKGEKRIANFYGIIKNIDDLTKIDSLINVATTKYYNEKMQQANEYNNLQAMKYAIIDRFFDVADYARYRAIENFVSMVEEQPEILTPNLKEVYNVITNIIYSTDKNKLIDIYNNLSKQNVMFGTVLNKVLNKNKQQLKVQYSAALNKTYPSKKTIKGVSIVDVTNEKFLLLIHNTQASITGRKPIDNPGLFAQQSINVNTISCSVISNDMLTIAKHYDKHLIYGFKNIDENDIYTMADKDAQIDWSARDGKLPFAENEFWHTPEQLPLNTKFGYNEVVIWRKTANNNKTPDFIVAFDEISEQEIRHAKYYNIPIYFIDKKKLYDKNISLLLKGISAINKSRKLSLKEIGEFYKKFIATISSLLQEDYDFNEFISQEQIKRCCKILKSLIEENKAENQLFSTHLIQILQLDYKKLDEAIIRKQELTNKTTKK